MKQNKEVEGRFSNKAHGLGTVTNEMVRARARELALINGRSEDQVLESDWTQARRELLGREPLAPSPTAAESLREEQRWDPVPGSEGTRTPTVPAPDEQTFPEKLVQEGIEDAEHDQMVRATRESKEKDRP